MAARDKLGLRAAETVTKSYIELLMDWRRERGSDERVIGF